jgi:hypothetical protein
MTGKSYRWTQPSCQECYEERYPSTSPSRMIRPESEQCCFCGAQTFDGLYVRVDPSEVPHPSLLKT